MYETLQTPSLWTIVYAEINIYPDKLQLLFLVSSWYLVPMLTLLYIDVASVWLKKKIKLN